MKRKKKIGWLDEEFDFDIEIPPDEPIFPLNIACKLLDMHYWTLHQILDEGLIERKKESGRKKMLSYKDIKRLKIVKYLMEEKGVNIKGIKVIFEMGEIEEI
jgi:MerR family transcriptional regulator/heat shock protein HspR